MFITGNVELFLSEVKYLINIPCVVTCCGRWIKIWKFELKVDKYMWWDNDNWIIIDSSLNYLNKNIKHNVILNTSIS